MEVMIDLETLGTDYNSVVLIIAGIKFDRNTYPAPKLSKMDTFYRRIDIDSCKDIGLTTDPSTTRWWFEQSQDIREEAMGSADLTNPRVHIRTALLDFKTWLGNSSIVWSHGATFDCVILQHLFKLCNFSPPWPFWLSRDTRTLFDIAGVKNTDMPANEKHHALHDCYRQIVGVNLAMNRLKK